MILQNLMMNHTEVNHDMGDKDFEIGPATSLQCPRCGNAGMKLTRVAAAAHDVVSARVPLIVEANHAMETVLRSGIAHPSLIDRDGDFEFLPSAVDVALYFECATCIDSEDPDTPWEYGLLVTAATDPDDGSAHTFFSWKRELSRNQR